MNTYDELVVDAKVIPAKRGDWLELDGPSIDRFERVLLNAAYDAASAIKGDLGDSWLWLKRTVAARAAVQATNKKINAALRERFGSDKHISWWPDSENFAAPALIALNADFEIQQVHPRAAGAAILLGFAKAMLAAELRALSDLDGDDMTFYEQPADMKIEE